MTKSRLNREWHLAHKMPPKATLEQRLEWHIEHAKNCQCRPIEGKIAEEMKKRGIAIPGVEPATNAGDTARRGTCKRADHS